MWHRSVGQPPCLSVCNGGLTRGKDRCTPELLADAALRYFRDPAHTDRLLPKYVKLHALLKKDASREAAAAIAELMSTPSPAPQAKG